MSDKDCWDSFIKSIRPTKKRKQLNIQFNTELYVAKRKAYTRKPQLKKLPDLSTGQIISMDKSLIRKIGQGKRVIDDILDLHGCTLDKAYIKLNEFISASFSSRKRCVLVISGKGRDGEENGNRTIKEQIPLWLNNQEMRSYILYFGLASKKHGGGGAFYVLIRKDKSTDL